jgi:hypothetical protein
MINIKGKLIFFDVIVPTKGMPLMLKLQEALRRMLIRKMLELQQVKSVHRLTTQMGNLARGATELSLQTKTDSFK